MENRPFKSIFDAYHNHKDLWIPANGKYTSQIIDQVVVQGQLHKIYRKENGATETKKKYFYMTPNSLYYTKVTINW